MAPRTTTLDRVPGARRVLILARSAVMPLERDDEVRSASIAARRVSANVLLLRRRYGAPRPCSWQSGSWGDPF